jgi:hypothetical protein
MRHKKLKLSALLLLGLGLTGVHAQTMFVRETSGTQTSYPLNNISKLSFSSGNIIVDKMTGSPDTYTLTSVRYLNFTDLTGISEAKPEIAGVKIYPNPANEVLNIQSSSTAGSTVVIEVISIEGKILYTHSVNAISDVFQINISNLPEGLYLCKINNGTTIETAKFIKQ